MMDSSGTIIMGTDPCHPKMGCCAKNNSWSELNENNRLAIQILINSPRVQHRYNREGPTEWDQKCARNNPARMGKNIIFTKVELKGNVNGYF
jgi:hypothetical protein